MKCLAPSCTREATFFPRANVGFCKFHGFRIIISTVKEKDRAAEDWLED